MIYSITSVCLFKSAAVGLAGVSCTWRCCALVELRGCRGWPFAAHDRRRPSFPVSTLFRYSLFTQWWGKLSSYPENK
ncbi:hypothetical protein D915_007518 [Fasciola hepatica]|uniref:Uncharacterized protein n=1 Tax=Fasciola hepatica TaxID=6192 RepID=A0A4E0RJM6_FASHE|nr:hypothetical protein D915_007518 [Fasciola hepatica]